MRIHSAALFILFFPSLTFAGEADIIAARVESAGGDNYRFHVTVQHNDENWEHYAKAWEVHDMDGNLLGTRILRHPHIREQPFTRSLTVAIPDNVNEISIRAYDLIHKYGGKELTLKLDKVNKHDTE